MNILELCLSPDYGGLEIHMRDFSRWLAKRKDCQLFLAVREDTRLHRALTSLSVPLFCFTAKAGKLPFGKARRLARFIEENAIDIVHVHWKYDLPLTALAKRISRRPFKFVHTRQVNMPGKKRDPYHRFIYGSMDCFIAITRYLEKQAQTNLPLAKEKIRQIYYGFEAPPPVAPERTRQLRQQLQLEGKFSVGLLGRISEFKGQHLLIEAVEKLKKEGIAIHARIVGEPFEREYVERLKSYVAQNHLQEQVHFMDFYENPFELITCFDVLALTTKRETFGLVLIEGMHAGVAVIGSDEGGVPEIIDDGETGLLFRSGDSASLAGAIKKIYSDENLRKKITAAGQKKAREKFAAEIQYQKMLQTFDQLLEKNSD